MNHCVIHRSHRPAVHGAETHHVHPKASGGPTTAGNLVDVCPTGHDAIHDLLREWGRHGGRPPWRVRRRWGRAEQWLAEEGWRRMHGDPWRPLPW